MYATEDGFSSTAHACQDILVSSVIVSDDLFHRILRQISNLYKLFGYGKDITYYSDNDV